MSSQKQETSPEQQRQEIIGLAKRKGFEIVGWYVDEGISGDEIEKRPDFRRMLQDAEDGQFDVILCWDQDRFGRFDSLKAGYVIEPLRMRGVRLVTVTQGDIDWNDFAGRMMYAIQQEGKNQYLHSLSQNVLRGRIQIAREGHGVARAPIGYDRVFYDAAGNLVHRIYGGEKFAKPKAWKSMLDISENTDEVESLQFAFERYANSDIGLRRLANELNDRGSRTRKGVEWEHTTLGAVMRNPVYKGTLVYGRVPQGRFNWVGNGNVGGDGPIVVENAHPAIVDDETFDAVQRKLADRRNPLKRPRCNDYILSGLLVCGMTGKKFAGRRTTWGSEFRYYTVKRTEENGSESCFSLRKDRLEGFVLARIIEVINQSELRERIRKAVEKRLKRRKKAPDSKKLEKQLADLDQKIQRATERILLIESDGLEDANRLLANWRTQRRRVATELDQLSNNTDGDLDAHVDAVMEQLANLEETIHLADPEKLKPALRATIESITLYWGPGGPRKWRLERGIIRLREPLLFTLPLTIPMFHLPNGTRPFVVDTFVSSKLFAHADFSTIENEDLKRIWTHAASRQFDSLLSIYWTRAEPNVSFSLSAWLNFDNKRADRTPARFTSKVRCNKDVEVNFKFFQEMFEEVVNTHGSISVDDTSTSTETILNWTIDVTDCMDIYPIAQGIEQTISGDKDWWSRPWGMTIYDRLTPIKQVRKGRCFDDLAAQFNELYRDWNTSFDAFYHVDFNPYADPEIIPAESMEIRLPLGKLRRRNVHFDIIHAADGSFIELRSPTRNSIKRVGKEAGLELNEWCRDSSQRWLSKEQ